MQAVIEIKDKVTEYSQMYAEHKLTKLNLSLYLNEKNVSQLDEHLDRIKAVFDSSVYSVYLSEIDYIKKYPNSWIKECIASLYDLDAFYDGMALEKMVRQLDIWRQSYLDFASYNLLR